MKKVLGSVMALGLSLAVTSCSSTQGPSGGGGKSSTTQGTQTSGGATSLQGGTSAAGGTVGSSGGSTLFGGLPSSGGTSAGGTSSSGGRVATGGTTNSSGTTSSAGTTARGGTTGSVVTSVSGGTTSSGGTTTATGGTTAGGGKTGTGGVSATGGATGAGGTKGSGGSTGTGGAPASGIGPCDIYAAASPATPCVAAYSMARVLYSKYAGPLYQVRKGGSWTKTTGPSGGTFKDIGTVDGGYADVATQDTFCEGATCTVSILYDQSGKNNHLKAAPKGCYEGGDGAAAEPDKESVADKRPTTLNGHKVYALQNVVHDGYRNNAATGMPTGTAAQGIYMVADGKKSGSNCCWDFGNAMPTNCADGTGSMNALFLGTGFFGKGVAPGPWFMGDFEFGVWAGGSASVSTGYTNPNLPSMNTTEFAFGILKTSTSGSTGQYCIRTGNAQSGEVKTAWDGQSPQPWRLGGAIILGIGGDNSNWSFGTFFEGVITAGRPSDDTDALVLKNVQAAKYGQ